MGAQAQRRTLIFDNDGSELLLNTYWNEQPLTLWQLDSLVDIQRDTQVGTYAICASCSEKPCLCSPEVFCRRIC